MMIAQKKRVAALMVAATCAFVSAGSASASPIVLAGSDTWNAWTTSQLMSGRFWANWSYDPGGYANVGYFLSGKRGSDVPGFYDASPYSVLPYLGEGSTTFALNLTDPMDFGHLLSVTGWNDEFGLFDVATGRKYPLFDAWETMGQTTTFYPSGVFGLYLTNGDNQTWYSTTLDGGRSHFALFQGTNAWYLGVEDATYTTNWTADWDYNDVIIKWAEPVPEVGSMSMLGLALLSLGAARRRWLK
jgi:hypothetical protein